MRRLFLLGFLFLAASATAQPTAERAACTFDTCAIWLEDGYFLGEIRRGDTADSERVRGVGILGGGLVEHVEDVPPALAEATRARSLRISAIVTGVAAFAFSTAAQVYAIEGNDVGTVGVLSLASLGLSLYSGNAVLRARGAESRAVHEFNRQFAD